MRRCVALASLFALFLASASLAVAAPIAVAAVLSNPWAAPSWTASGPDPTFYFTFTIGPDTGYGSLNTTDLGGGEFLATSGSLIVTGGPDVGTYSLYPGGPGQTTSPSEYFYYDDVLYPSSDPGLDIDGLLFAGNGLEINIWGTGPDSYTFYDNTGYGNSGGPFEVVPEPAALVLLSFGLAGLWFSRRKKA